MKEKRIASDKLMTFIINVLCESPSGQISEDVIKFRRPHTIRNI
jgi:hypothetical protein